MPQQLRKSSKTRLSSFCVGDVVYEHVLDTGDDSTSIVAYDDMTCTPVFTVDSWAVVFDKQREVIGRFKTDDSRCWVFQSNSGEFFNTGAGLRSLLEAEVLLFKQLLSATSHGVLKQPETTNLSM